MWEIDLIDEVKVVPHDYWKRKQTACNIVSYMAMLIAMFEICYIAVQLFPPDECH